MKKGHLLTIWPITAHLLQDFKVEVVCMLHLPVQLFLLPLHLFLDTLPLCHQLGLPRLIGAPWVMQRLFQAEHNRRNRLVKFLLGIKNVQVLKLCKKKMYRS